MLVIIQVELISSIQMFLVWRRSSIAKKTKKEKGHSIWCPFSLAENIKRKTDVVILNYLDKLKMRLSNVQIMDIDKIALLL